MYRNGFYRHRIVGLFLILLLVPLFPIAIKQTTQTKTAKFVLASWDYPDDYGQGIENIAVAQNSSGSWVSCAGSPYYSTEETVIEIPEGEDVAIRLIVYSYLNRSYIGLPEPWNQGHLYIRHRVNVTALSLGENVFSQQNFTYDSFGGTADPVEWYKHSVILSFSPVGGESYAALVNYEIYYETTTQGEPYLHDCSNTDGIVYDSNSGLGGGDYGIGSDGSVVEIWIIPDSVSDEKVIYKLDFTNIDNSDGDVNLTVRYRVEDGFIGFRLDLYYDDATSDSIGTQISQTWENQTIDADTKTLDYALLYCDDYPSSVSSGNRSVYVDFIEITNPTGSLAYWVEQWNVNTELVLNLYSPIDEWGMNTALIIGGLIMIPASSLFLVWGGKNKVSSDKLFFALLAFVMGWGLLVGGIMP